MKTAPAGSDGLCFCNGVFGVLAWEIGPGAAARDVAAAGGSGGRVFGGGGDLAGRVVDLDAPANLNAR